MEKIAFGLCGNYYGKVNQEFSTELSTEVSADPKQQIKKSHKKKFNGFLSEIDAKKKKEKKMQKRIHNKQKTEKNKIRKYVYSIVEESIKKHIEEEINKINKKNNDKNNYKNNETEDFQTTYFSLKIRISNPDRKKTCFPDDKKTLWIRDNILWDKKDKNCLKLKFIKDKKIKYCVRKYAERYILKFYNNGKVNLVDDIQINRYGYYSNTGLPPVIEISYSEPKFEY